jgi:cytochrome c peroxidase
MRLHLKNKQTVLATFSVAVLLTILTVAFTDKETPLARTQALCVENIKLMQAQLDTFQRLAEAKADRELLVERLKKTRTDFKRFEFIVEYIDNRQHPFINGANAIEMDDGYNPNAKPEGLQVIESELFEDSLHYDNIVFLTKQLKFRILSFYLMFNEARLQDTYIFEAIRFNFIRIETLSLVSFDSPDMRNNFAEINASLDAFDKILNFYNSEKSIPQILLVKSMLKKAAAYLATKNFNTLDRLYYIKQFIQPVVKDLIVIQEKLAVPYLDESGKLFRIANLKSPTIYDTDFLNPNFFAQDKYYISNEERTALGKKMFFDKRLSADNSMSCATCHQPENFFADKLPAAITNKAGEFQKRNTPSLMNVAYQSGYFYDFAAPSLENQVDHVVTNPLEYNHHYDEILLRLKADTQYVRMFAAAFPEFASDPVSVYGINLCIADFQRQFRFLNSKFDRYMRGETSLIDAPVRRGFNLFMGKAQCGACHFAPTYFGTLPPFYGTTESEVLGITKSFDTIRPVLDDDIGRFKHFEMDPFKFSFKTSTVRNAQLTAPYMHNGGFKTLEEVVEFYNMGGGVGMGLDIPNQTLVADRLHLTEQDKKDIIAFMHALTDTSGMYKFRE